MSVNERAPRAPGQLSATLCTFVAPSKKPSSWPMSISSSLSDEELLLELPALSAFFLLTTRLAFLATRRWIFSLLSSPVPAKRACRLLADAPRGVVPSVLMPMLDVDELWSSAFFSLLARPCSSRCLGFEGDRDLFLFFLPPGLRSFFLSFFRRPLLRSLPRERLFSFLSSPSSARFSRRS